MFGIEAMDLGSIWTWPTIKMNWSILFAFYSPLLLQKEKWLELFQPECNTQQYAMCVLMQQPNEIYSDSLIPIKIRTSDYQLQAA